MAPFAVSLAYVCTLQNVLRTSEHMRKSIGVAAVLVLWESNQAFLKQTFSLGPIFGCFERGRCALGFGHVYVSDKIPVLIS
jgi:hypothetical protein